MLDDSHTPKARDASLRVGKGSLPPEGLFPSMQTNFVGIVDQPPELVARVGKECMAWDVGQEEIGYCWVSRAQCEDHPCSSTWRLRLEDADFQASLRYSRLS